jgi:hypothetical protein
MAASVRCPQCGQTQSTGPSCTACGAPLGGTALQSGHPLSKVTTSVTDSEPAGVSPAGQGARREGAGRASALSLLRLFAFWGFWPAFVAYVSCHNFYYSAPAARSCSSEAKLLGFLDGVFLLIVMILPLVGVVLEIVTASRIKRDKGRAKGGLSGVSGIGLNLMNLLLAIILLPNLVSDARRSMYSRAAIDARTAVIQAIEYSKDRHTHPSSMRALRDSQYANIADKDPWGKDWVFSPVLSEGRKPEPGDHVYVYSKGPCGTGTFSPRNSATGRDGAVGYSSIYGAFSGS